MITLAHIFLVLLGIVWIYPFLWMVCGSLKTNLEFLSSGLQLLPKVFRWQNYVRAWAQAHFSTYFFNSVILTVSVVVLVVVLCALSGYALGRIDFPGRKVIIGVVTGLMFVPQGYTIVPLYELIRTLGLDNTLVGVILAQASGAHVLFILLFTAFFSTMPKELEESANIDGAGFLRTFARIMLPMAKPIIATTCIMQFIWTWNSFLVPLVFTLNNPSLRTLAVGMYAFIGQYQTDWSGMAAGATISLIPIILVFVALQRYFVDGIAGAIKG